jgi:hypothetical protein
MTVKTAMAHSMGISSKRSSVMVLLEKGDTVVSSPLPPSKPARRSWNDNERSGGRISPLVIDCLDRALSILDDNNDDNNKNNEDMNDQQLLR